MDTGTFIPATGKFVLKPVVFPFDNDFCELYSTQMLALAKDV